MITQLCFDILVALMFTATYLLIRKPEIERNRKWREVFKQEHEKQMKRLENLDQQLRQDSELKDLL